MPKNPDNFSNTQIREIARFRAELNAKKNYAVFSMAQDVWLVFDVESDNEWTHHEDDMNATTIDDCEYVDLWIN